MMHYIQRTLIAGLLILIPVFVTYVLIRFLFNLFAGVGAPLVNQISVLLSLDQNNWLGPMVPLVNLILALAVVFLLGLVGTNFLGRRILAAIEAPLMRVPLVSSIYGAVKQLVDTFRGPGRSFQRVVLLEYPRKGVWMMGFVASERRNPVQSSSSSHLLAVFVPTTPNPTSGYIAMVPPEDVIELNYSVEEAFKFVVSSGIVGKDLTEAVIPAEPGRVRERPARVTP